MGRPAKKKKKGISFRLTVLLVLLAVGVAFGVMLMIPAFDITEVYCENEHTDILANEDIVTAANIKNGTNILLANIGAAKRNVSEIPTVKDVKLRRVFPNKICITVETRIPAAYVASGGNSFLVDCDGMVLEQVSADKSARIAEQNTPKFNEVTEKNENKNSSKSSEESEPSETSKSSENEDEDLDENGDDNDENVTEKSDEDKKDVAADNSSESSNKDADEKDKICSVPLAVGIELKKTDEGKPAEAEDSEKFDTLIEICNALNEAGLLNRTTYIDLNNTSDVSIVVENRLDIRLGLPDNIYYRAKFLAETINTKISSTEVLILEYTGDDIYARPHEDGKDRVVKKASKKSEEKSLSEDSDEAESNDKKQKSNDEDVEDDEIDEE